MDKILVVDDCEQNIELISRHLLSAGYEVLSAKDGESAIKKVKLYKPDIILLDLIMPRMSGYDVCTILKNTEETKYVLVLILTAIDNKESRIRAFEAGADDYMTKMSDNVVLLSKVKSLLRIKHLGDQLKIQYEEIEEKNKQIDFQLKMARQVQSSLIQEVNFTINNVTFISKYKPALEIGGDLYDIANINKDLVSVFIGDVSGHGISAALLTAMIKIMFKSLVVSDPQPDRLFYRLNQELYSIFSNSSIDVYACAFYAHIDTINKTITYSNAGHALPLFVNRKDNEVKEMEVVGTPLGMLQSSKYVSHQIVFNEGDTMLLYTDGLSDSFYKNSNDEFLKKIKSILLEYSTDIVKPDELIQILLDEFCNTNEKAKYINDDISVILCQM